MADVGKIFTYLAYLQDVAIAYLCGKYCDAIAQFIILFIYILNEYSVYFFITMHEFQNNDVCLLIYAFHAYFPHL